MNKFEIRKKQKHYHYNKRVHYLLGSIIGLIFLVSLLYNGVAVSTKAQTLGTTDMNAEGYDQNWTSGNGHWYFQWNSTWTVPTTLAQIQNMSAALDQAFDFLVTNWGLPDSLHPATAYEPPMEVYIVEKNGYNGAACWNNAHPDMDLWLKFYPAYLQISDRTHEPLKVASHEFLHICQVKAPGDVPADWVLEGQARMTQEKTDDWLDHCDGTEAGTSYLRQLQAYLTGSHTSDLTALSYDACLFWNYVCEQFGSHRSDPDFGFDIIADFWDTAVNPSGTDGITMFNNLMAHLGTGQTFEDVFKNFCIANYAKDFSDATVPSEWEYIDDNAGDGSAAYGPVSRRISGTTITTAGSVSGNAETINRFASKYYEVDIDPSVRAITVQFNQTTNNQLFYAMLCTTGNDLEYYYTVESTSFQRAIVNQGYDKMVIIVVGLENAVANPATFKYLIEGAYPEIYIESPQNTPANFQARAGPHNAPEKFPAVVSVSHRKTAPMHGLAATNFKAYVGGIAAPVLAAVDVWGDYFLEIQAPSQSADGLYSLKVDLVDSDGTTIIATDTNVDSVRYGASYIDNALVIDRSGSMADHNKILAAKSAAKLYVDSYLSEDQMAVVQFTTTANVLRQLLKLTVGNRAADLAAIDSITTATTTSIGDGLLKGQNELYIRGIANYSKEIILLSDGMENTAPLIANILPLLLANGTKVNCIKIGYDNDDEVLQGLAGDTGGSYFFCFDPASGDIPNDLAEIYRSIVNNIRNLERFYQARGTMAASSIQSFLIPVKNDADYLEIVVHYNATKNPTNVILRNATGATITPWQSNSVNGMGHRVYQINNPGPGTWNVTIDPDNTGSSLTYYVEAACRSSITMQVMAPPVGSVSNTWGDVTRIGDPEPIIVFLSDSKPIQDATVMVEVTPPSYKTKGIKFQIPLYDDGAHNDGLPDDGVYGNLITPTSEDGSYSFIVNATGTSNDYGTFTRIRTGAFQITNQQGRYRDSDKDGLPDNWELRYGLDPNKATGENGASGDPDKDALNNSVEFFWGTNPLSSDTDLGGESDGSEVLHNRNPLNAKDDRLPEFPPVQLIPGNKSVKIIPPKNTGYTTLTIYRSNLPILNYTIVFSSAYPSSWNNTALTNYKTYYYRFQAENSTGKTGLSHEYSAIPKLNVISPEGCLIINGGNKTTTSNLVTLEVLQVAHDKTNTDANKATYMRFGNTAEQCLNAGWSLYWNETTWLLPGTIGVRTLFAQLRDSQTVPEVSPIFTAGIYFTGSEIVGPETTTTILLILIDLLVLTIIVYRKKKPGLKIVQNY